MDGATVRCCSTNNSELCIGWQWPLLAVLHGRQRTVHWLGRAAVRCSCMDDNGFCVAGPGPAARLLLAACSWLLHGRQQTRHWVAMATVRYAVFAPVRTAAANRGPWQPMQGVQRDDSSKTSREHEPSRTPWQRNDDSRVTFETFGREK